MSIATGFFCFGNYPDRKICLTACGNQFSENYIFLPKKKAKIVFPQVKNAESSLAATGEWMDRGMKGWGATEVSQLSKTRTRPSTLVPTNDQRPWIPAAPLGQQLLPSPASLQALKGTWQQLSWLPSCLAEQQLRDGDRQPCCASRVAKPAETLSSQLLPPNAKLAL